ncbi:MAG TPA: hypothetical protein VED63_10545 [Acidimicrobiales bacterium]|nr:hypothetical protein [Acidimicrobiales bacterium]
MPSHLARLVRRASAYIDKEPGGWTLSRSGEQLPERRSGELRERRRRQVGNYLNADNFADLDALADRLVRFEERYNATATPFDWRFTTKDLLAMLERLEAHQPLSLAA